MNEKGYSKIEEGEVTRHRFEEPAEGDEFFGVDVDFEALRAERDTLKGELYSNLHMHDFVAAVDIYLSAMTEEAYPGLSYTERKPYVDEKIRGLISNITEKMLEETSVQDELEGIVDITRLPHFQDYIKEQDVSLFSGEEKGKEKTLGSQDIASGAIEILDRLSNASPFWILQMLSEQGLPDGMTTLFHEKVHVLQWDEKGREGFKNRKKRWLKDEHTPTAALIASVGLVSHANERVIIPSVVALLALYVIKRIHTKGQQINETNRLLDKLVLDEVHAQKADRVLSSGNNKTYIDLVEYLDAEYKHSSPNDMDRVIVGAQQVDRLRALGFSHEEIGALNQKAEWDEELIGFRSLEDAMSKRAEERDLSEVQVDSLVDAIKIKQEIALLKMRKIAQQETIQFARDQGLEVHMDPEE